MAFRCQVHDCIDGFVGQDRSDAFAVANVDFVESVIRAFRNRSERAKTGGIGQLVHVDDVIVAALHEVPAHSAADEPRAAGYQDPTLAHPQKPVSMSASAGAERSLSKSVRRSAAI